MSDVMDDNPIEEGRYRGFDVDDDVENVACDADNSTKKMSLVTNGAAETCATTVSALQRRMEDQATTIAQLQEELARYTTEDNDDTGENQTKKKRKRRGRSIENDKDMAVIADLSDKDIEIRLLTEENIMLKEQLARRKAQEPVENHVMETKEPQAPPKPTVADKSTEAKTTHTNSPPLPNITTLLHDMQTAMENKISEMKESIQSSIEEKIAKTYETHKKTYASTASSGIEESNTNTKGNSLQSIMIEAKNAEIILENERQKRENNIIIHGVKENIDSSDENKKGMDDTYITALLLILGVNVKPKSITRLGTFNANGNCRPLKLIMNSTEEKSLIMSRLSNLKTAEEQYRNISVKDDYTLEERNLIKTWHQKAEEMNKMENTTDWKVRGTPKNGLRLVKISKKTQ